MPRKILTETERIERHVKRFNQKEISKAPLFADQIEVLLERGIIRSKTVAEANASFGAEVIKEKFDRMDRESFELGERCKAFVLERGRQDLFDSTLEYWNRVFERHGKPKTNYWASVWMETVTKNFGKLEALTLMWQDRQKAETEMAMWVEINRRTDVYVQKMLKSTPPSLFEVKP